MRGLTNKLQPIAKPSSGFGLTNIAEHFFLTSILSFNQQLLWADRILMPHLHKTLLV